MVNAPELSFRGAKRRGNLAVLSPITGQPRRNRNCLPEIAAAPSGPRNDKSGGIAPLNLCRDHRQPAWRSMSAATDARNWSMRFYRQPVRIGNAFPRLQRPLRGLAMTNLGACTVGGVRGNLQVRKALTERRYRRTQLVNAFLSAASANRQCLPEIAASACGLLAMTIRGWCHFNANLYRLFLQSRAGLLIVQKRCPALELQSGAEQISFLRRRPSCP